MILEEGAHATLFGMIILNTAMLNHLHSWLNYGAPCVIALCVAEKCVVN